MKNEYKVKGDKVYIKLSQGQVTVIDLEDLERVDKEYSGTWFTRYDKNTRGYYIYGNTTVNHKQKAIALHRWILDVTNTAIKVDHRNHNTLDNTRDNLRACTNQENQRNRKPKLNSSSKYKGVSLNKTNGKWRVIITYNHKRIHLGYFDNEDDAARVYDQKAKELFGEFCYLNFPEE